jgi:hypothetical protein
VIGRRHIADTGRTSHLHEVDVMPKSIRRRSQTGVRGVSRSEVNPSVRNSDDIKGAHSAKTINGVPSHVEECYATEQEMSFALSRCLDFVTGYLSRLCKLDADYDPIGMPTEGEAMFVNPPGPLPSIDPNSETVTRALRHINPAEGLIAACRKEIAYTISLLILLDKIFEGTPAAGQRNKELDKAIAALAKAKSAIRAMSPDSRPLSYILRQPFWNAVFKLLEQLTQALKLNLNKERNLVGDGKPIPNFTKINAACSAFDLLSQFANKRPTKTIGGTFYELASVLYEAVTNKPGVDLSRFCRREIDQRRMFPQPDELPFLRLSVEN